MNNDLIINVTNSEIVIALLEDKELVELHKEKKNKQFTVGDIYLGKVRKIMTGLNAAFIDVGYEKDAFLHYLDLGPQFKSLSKYVQIAIDNPKNVPLLQDFERVPDINKFGKINELFKSGQRVLVQIAKEPISTKGPRLSSEISIAGRNLVLLPFSNKVSISQKIKSKEERDRLKRLIYSIKPKNYGVIIRTVAKNRRVAVLDSELRSLIERWETAVKQLARTSPPQLIIGELNRTSALLRDILNNTFNSIIVNDSSIYYEAKEFINNIAPEKEKIVKLYTGKASPFEQYSIDKQIKLLFGKTVTFKNGAYLIIEHTEALHVIDVNSGNRSTNTDQETNALEVNLAAADEIARQLRLRDIGGIIVVDFIDMHQAQHKKQVYIKMKEAMSKDRTKHSILPLSKFGLMQITRQRVRPEMNIETVETCPTCSGTGEITPSILFIDEIENNLKYILSETKSRSITIKVHPYIRPYLRKRILKWNFRYKIRIKLKDDRTYHLLQYEFYDKAGEMIKY